MWVFALGPRRRLTSATTTRPVIMSLSGVPPKPPARPAGRWPRPRQPLRGRGATSTGVFTAAQASRGEAQFNRACSSCHQVGEQTGASFTARWGSGTLADLFTMMSTTMPQSSPGSLSPEDYASIVAFYLQRSGFASGADELPAKRGGVAGDAGERAAEVAGSSRPHRRRRRSSPIRSAGRCIKFQNRRGRGRNGRLIALPVPRGPGRGVGIRMGQTLTGIAEFGHSTGGLAMRAMHRLSAIVVVLALQRHAAAGRRPKSMPPGPPREKASASNASRYAPESLAAAEAAQTALDAELAAQDAKWVKSYDRARELAATARTGEREGSGRRGSRQGARRRRRQGRRGEGQGRRRDARQAGDDGGPRRRADPQSDQGQGRHARVSRGGEVGSDRRHGAGRTDRRLPTAKWRMREW